MSLPQDVREQVVAILNQQLADTFDLYSQTKQAHWNVKGIHFQQLHELFDGLAETVLEYVDMIAERATALGGVAYGTARMAAKNTSLPEFEYETPDGTEALSALIDLYARYGASIREAIDTTADLGDIGTSDLFTEIVREIDKRLYFLESHLQ
jgi:starvation-inducible DNA-binding protein